MVPTLWRLTPLAIALTIAVSAAPPDSANAALSPGFGNPGGGDGGMGQVTTGGARWLLASTGNGSDNQNQPRVFSPTNNVGVQHISSVAKWFAVQAGYCKRKIACKVNENMWFAPGGGRGR
ncbi:hypothetical protein [Microbispora sp. H11081]|uniref:hypothetical protein n=1 Tax=Microbispora sp. H11081 TaxID=2729107 RepID=UPI0014752BB9|nr:hypothetical protein [Microbispora sp. H11081]